MTPDSIIKANALLERQPTDADAWYKKGEAHRQSGDIATAISAYNQALKLKPDFAEACYALGETLEASGKIDLAIKTYSHWLKILQSGPGIPPAPRDETTAHDLKRLHSEGKAQMKRGDFVSAQAAFEQLLAIDPDIPDALINLAAIYFRMRRLGETEAMLLHCLRVKPHNTDALNLLGGCFKDTKRVPAAVAAYKQCIEIEAKHLAAWSNLGKCYLDLKRYEDCLNAYEQALAIDPNHADSLGWLMHLLHYTCKWDRSVELRDRFRAALASGATCDPFMVAVHTPEMLLGNTRQWVKSRFPLTVPYASARPLPADARGDGKLRIGYLSSDYHRHATTALISEMFEHHDRARFEIYAYSHGMDDGSPDRRRVIASVDTFRDIATISDSDAAQMIKNDAIDILVDLKGYSNGHRLSLMSRRTAPLQMHYLGYPGTLGADFIDYFISDGGTTPPGADAWFHEKLIRLPMSYQINDRKRPLPTPRPRSYYGLPEEGLVFCDFNSSYKIMPEVFAVWMNVLKAIPDSVLWLFVVNIHTIMNIRSEAVKQGVDARRIIIGGEMSLADHLSRYQHVDLALDTTPCSGHTTSSDALWCGAPVVTIAGNSFAGRVSAGLLHSVGLPELIANTPEEYESKILELARQPEKLKDLRKYLEQGRMTFPLFDSAATTRAIELAYLRTSDIHRSGKQPESFSIV